MRQRNIKEDGYLTQWNKLGLRSWLLGVVALSAMGAGIVGSEFQHVDITVQSPTGKQQRSIWTFATGVRSIIRGAGIKIQPHDWIKPKNRLTASHAITVRKAIPVTIVTPRRTWRVWTTRYRVSAVLARAQVKLGPLDQVTPGLGAHLSAATKINVIRRRWVTKRVALKIPYAIEHQADPRLAQGKTVIRAGRYGKRIKTLRQLLQNGRVVKTVTLGLRRVEPSRPEVIDFGTARPVSRGGTVPQFTKVIRMSATAYWPDPAWSSGYTYTGLKAQYGIAAVDPSVIPLGTHLYIPGYGFALAADIGGAIKGDRIDLCYDTLKQAQTWGLRQVNVYILGPG